MPNSRLGSPFKDVLSSDGHITILQLNVEGLSAAKRDIICELAKSHSADVLLLQETHTTDDQQLPINGYSIVSLSHHRQYGLATYTKDGIAATELCSSGTNCTIYWNAIRIGEQIIVNVYKPPDAEWPSPALPPFPAPVAYCGDFNSPHTSWGYNRDS